MSATAIKRPAVRATFDRWFEDQLLDTDMTAEAVSDALDLNSTKSLSRRINNPEAWSGEEFIRLARLFNKHWYTDLVCVFPELRPVLSKINLEQAFADAIENGQRWDLYDHVA